MLSGRWAAQVSTNPLGSVKPEGQALHLSRARRLLLAAALFGFACAPGTRVEPDSGNAAQSPESAEWPVTCQQAIDLVLSGLDESSKREIATTPREDLVSFHHGWGMGIRNGTGMWRGNVPLVDSCIARRPGSQRHPDTASMIIIEEVWESLQGAP